MAIPAASGAHALANGLAYTVHRRVWIEHADGVLYDYTSHAGVDWVEGIEFGKSSIDDPEFDVTITLRREADAGSLAPLMEGSVLNQNAGVYARRIEMSRAYSVDVAITAVGASPTSGQWINGIVAGTTDVVDWGNPGVIKVEARGRTAVFDRIVTNPQTYGSPGGVPLEDVIQEFLDDEYGAGYIALVVPESPGFAVTEYTPVEGSSVREVLDQLSGHVGWYIEERWAGSALGLTLVRPRTLAEIGAADAQMGPGQIIGTKRIRWGRSDRRTVVRVTYRSAATGEIETVEERDEAAILELGGVPEGERIIHFTEAEGSALDTEAEATDYALAVLSNLKDAAVDYEIENLFWPWVELGDYIEWLPDDVHFDAAYTWAVVGYRHTITRSSFRTTISTRGLATAGHKRWLKRETPTSGGVTVDDTVYDVLRIETVAKGDDYVDVVPIVGAAVESVWFWDVLWPLDGTVRTAPTDPATAVILEVGEDVRLTVPPQGYERVGYFSPYTSSLRAGKGKEFAVGPAFVNDPWFEFVDSSPGTGSNRRDITIRVRDPQGLAGVLEVWTNPAGDANPTGAGAADGTFPIPSTPATVGAGNLAALNEVLVHPANGKTIRLQFTNTNGATTGQQTRYIQGASTLTTLEDELRDAAVSRAKILDEAVNDLKLAAAAVTEAKVATAAISTDKIAAAAVNAAKIAAAAVEEAKIAAAAVTNAKIGALAVTTAKIALLAVTADLLAASAVTETKISNDAISTPKLQANAVTAAKIAANTITAAQIAAGTITAVEIAAGTITGTQIAGATITAGKLVAGTITSAEIAAGTITGGNIASDTIQTSNLAALVVTAAKIAALTITADKIAATTITADKIAAATITGDKIAGLTITGDKISANAITADKISVADLAAINGTFSGNLGASTIGVAGKLYMQRSYGTDDSASIEWGSPATGSVRIRPSAGSYSGSAATLYMEFSSLGVYATKYTFQDNGTAVAAGVWADTSDARLKEEVAEIRDGLACLIRLRGIRYRPNEEGRRRGMDERVAVGFLAQETEGVIPEIVTHGEDGFAAVAYGRVSAYLPSAFAEIDERLRAIEARMASC